MVKDSIDIQPPYAKKRREFIARHKNSRPDSIYTQKRDFNNRGLLEKETWKLDNGRQVLDLDEAVYISKEAAEKLRMETLEPSALMRLAKKNDYTAKNGLICFLYGGQIYYSSPIVEVNPSFEEDFEPEYDISQDFK